MQAKITTLIENSLGENLALQNEHGLSFFIETWGDMFPPARILFDTGQSKSFIDNAGLLNIDLTKTDKVVLSHGHYDHSGGFKDFVRSFGRSYQLFTGTDFFNPKYASNNGAWEFLGNNFDRDYLEKEEINFTFVTEDKLEIAPGVYIVTNFPRTTEFEKPNERFYTFDGTDYHLDLFTDEVIIVLSTCTGLMMMLGCSHPGLVNILETVKARFDQPMHCIIGGTHLVEADNLRLDRTIEYLEGLHVPLLGISHCTGDAAIRRLQETEKRFFLNATGTSMVFN